MFNFQILIFYAHLISILKDDLITLIRKEKNFYDSGKSLEIYPFLLFSFPLCFIALSVDTTQPQLSK